MCIVAKRSPHRFVGRNSAVGKWMGARTNGSSQSTPPSQVADNKVDIDREDRWMKNVNRLLKLMISHAWVGHERAWQPRQSSAINFFLYSQSPFFFVPICHNWFGMRTPTPAGVHPERRFLHWQCFALRLHTPTKTRTHAYARTSWRALENTTDFIEVRNCGECDVCRPSWELLSFLHYVWRQALDLQENERTEKVM